jgi:hypothetical protein
VRLGATAVVRLEGSLAHGLAPSCSGSATAREATLAVAGSPFEPKRAGAAAPDLQGTGLRYGPAHRQVKPPRSRR